jgi:hypothetical protein
MLGIVGKILQFVKNVGHCGMHDEHILARIPDHFAIIIPFCIIAHIS